MAITSYSPNPASIPDPVTYDEASALFRETGYPVHKNTLARWVRVKKLPKERVGRTDYVSYSDLLQMHADWVRAQQDDQ